MRDKLQQYVNLLFAGAEDCDDVRQEILQNTLDRYDDLIAAGKVPEAAYRLAISGIGDINEILGTAPRPENNRETPVQPGTGTETDTPMKKTMRAVAVGLYILCPIPLFVLTDAGMSTLGLCATLAVVAAATVLILMCKTDTDTQTKEAEQDSPQMQRISKILAIITLIIYFPLSFLTGSWHITWLLFPIEIAARELARAILDYKEACKYEA